MNTDNDGGPAFPTAALDGTYTSHGMSLRDWFAGQALMGLLACSKVNLSSDFLASASYRAADSMIVERNGGES